MVISVPMREGDDLVEEYGKKMEEEVEGKVEEDVKFNEGEEAPCFKCNKMVSLSQIGNHS